MKRLVTLFIAMILVACGSPTASSPDTTPSVVSQPRSMTIETPTMLTPDAQTVRADLPRFNSAAISQAQLADVVQRQTAFSVNLYHSAIKHHTDNLIFSPYSVSLAFSMVYAGARGETQTEMARTLKFLPQETQHQVFNKLDQQIVNVGKMPDHDAAHGDAFQLHVANAVWGQYNVPFQQPYLDTLARNYGAGLHVLDFMQHPNESRTLINEWVATQTNKKITELMPADAVTAQTRLVLVNAMYFKASWLFPFDASATQNRVFTLLDGSEEQVPMMQRQGVRVPYMETDTYQAVQVPYVGQAVDMVIVLPKQTQFKTVEENLTSDVFNDIRQQVQERDVTLTMPRFGVKTSIDLKTLFTEIGMSNPFTPAADFSGIMNDRGLFIDAAVHQSTITVDEQGTEATAATGIAMAESALEQAELALNRPFLLAIMERKTGTILFLGRVVNPGP